MLSESLNVEKEQGLSADQDRLSVGQSVELEVVPVTKRRRFYSKYKLRVLEEAKQYTDPANN